MDKLDREISWAERYHQGDPAAIWRLWRKAVRLVRRDFPEMLGTIPKAVLERYDREQAARAKQKGRRRAQAR
jgi:hypothetical protein